MSPRRGSVKAARFVSAERGGGGEPGEVRGNALSHKETRTQREDERWGEGEPSPERTLSPNNIHSVIRASAWLPVAVAMVFAHFINEEICQGGEQERANRGGGASSAQKPAVTYGNKRPL